RYAGQRPPRLSTRIAGVDDDSAARPVRRKTEETLMFLSAAEATLSSMHSRRNGVVLFSGGQTILSVLRTGTVACPPWWAVVLIWTVTAAAGVNQWTPIRPETATFVTSFAVDPQNPDSLY